MGQNEAPAFHQYLGLDCELSGQDPIGYVVHLSLFNTMHIFQFIFGFFSLFLLGVLGCSPKAAD
jgi:hypothetical protein